MLVVFSEVSNAMNHVVGVLMVNLPFVVILSIPSLDSRKMPIGSVEPKGDFGLGFGIRVWKTRRLCSGRPTAKTVTVFFG